MPERRVAACVITGFLGSGKTTLLKGLLDRDPARERIAVVVNEIGEIGIDGRVLTGFEYVEQVIELDSGCVCCSIDEYRFDMAVGEILRRVDPVLLVLETSGVAHPAPTLERLRRCGLGIDSVITVVDARAWRRAWRISGAARRQVAAADFLVVSKSDLVSPRSVERLRKGLRGVNPRALQLLGAGASDFEGSDLLLATSASRRMVGAAVEGRPPDERLAAGPRPVRSAGAAAERLGDESIESFSVQMAGDVDRSLLVAALEDLPETVLRAKGTLRGTADRGAWLFQVVCGRVELSAIEGGHRLAPGLQGVFIGPGVLALREEIRARLAAAAIQ